jgi:hypothetical protein
MPSGIPRSYGTGSCKQSRSSNKIFWASSIHKDRYLMASVSCICCLFPPGCMYLRQAEKNIFLWLATWCLKILDYSINGNACWLSMAHWAKGGNLIYSHRSGVDGYGRFLEQCSWGAYTDWMDGPMLTPGYNWPFVKPWSVRRVRANRSYATSFIQIEWRVSDAIINLTYLLAGLALRKSDSSDCHWAMHSRVCLSWKSTLVHTDALWAFTFL